MSDKEQAKTRVDKDLYEKLDQHPDSIAEILREGAKMYMGNGDKRQLKEDLRDANEKYRRASREFERWQKKKEENLEEVHRLARELHEFKDPEEAYEEWLEGILDDYDENGPNLLPEIIRGKDGFEKFNKTASVVRNDLKKTAVRQERELTPTDFERPSRHELKSVEESRSRYLYELKKINDDGELEDRDREETEKMIEERMGKSRSKQESQEKNSETWSIEQIEEWIDNHDLEVGEVKWDKVDGKPEDLSEEYQSTKSV